MDQTPERLLNEAFFTSDNFISVRHQFLEHRYPLHWHEFFELTVVTDGQGTNIVNGESLPIRAGSVFLLTPSDLHEIVPDEGEKLYFYNIIFPRHALSDELYQLLFDEVRQNVTQFDQSEFTEARTAAEWIWSESRDNRSGKRLLMRGSLERLLILLMRHCREHPQASHHAGRGMQANKTHHPSIHKALVYLQHHFREPLTLELVAGEVQLSANYFSDLFRKSTGIPFQNYLQELRLEFAKALLSSSDLQITEVCFASGFSTLTHFERIFKRRFGDSPKRFSRKST